MVGAVAFESSFERTENLIADLYEGLVSESYLDGLDSYERFKTEGFHAWNDTAEVSTAFVRFLSRNRGYKSYIYFTDRTTRPDLGADQMHAILYRDLLRNLFQEYGSRRLRLIFEQNHKLDFELIATEAAEISAVRPPYSIEVGQKRAPHSLSIVDYAMAIFSRWRDTAYSTSPTTNKFRSWCAIRRWVAIVRSVEQGALYRRGHPVVSEERGVETLTSELNARDSRTQDGTLSSQPPSVAGPSPALEPLGRTEFVRSLGVDSQILESVGAAVREGQLYRVQQIRKRRGGLRKIYSPSIELKLIQKLIREELESALVYEDHPNVFGYISGRSIIDNARVHVGASVVLRVDLRDFFASITSDRVARALIDHGATQDLVSLLVPVLTADGILPAGFPTSPFISNLAFRHMDEALLELSNSHGLAYSRYGDDLNFSGEIDRDDAFLKLVERTLELDGWTVNQKKTRFMRRGGSQYVTGLYVGDSVPRAPRRTKRAIRAQSHFVSKHGFDDIAQARGHRVNTPARLAGWLGYLQRFEPDFVDNILGVGVLTLEDDRAGSRAAVDSSARGWDEYLSRGVLRHGKGSLHRADPS
ncbi:reverse transcriptase family protein [Cellulosimicrobium cellulans]|uniref:reverse transcriptase family protein n=1 Tax=Cellulosimicrobium cellulans TaxID=1710 RepID=UPI0018837F08|nr:reverse transcriptase family protein [Cellulosimicrobium cellulans]MBE9938039.1 RNA-directed DNA polymerase [Cellulosimicrobium cellulans]